MSLVIVARWFESARARYSTYTQDKRETGQSYEQYCTDKKYTYFYAEQVVPVIFSLSARHDVTAKIDQITIFPVYFLYWVPMLKADSLIAGCLRL